MDMITTLALVSGSPLTGDRFPVLPIILIGGIAVVIAVVSTIMSKKKDDEDK